MRLKDYITDNVLYIVLSVLKTILIEMILIFFNVNIYANILIISIMFLTEFIIIISIYIKKRIFYNQINNLLKNLDQAYLVTEMIKNPDFLEGKLLCDYLYSINKSYLENINKYKYNQEELVEYIELWCHEIKTPLSTSKLLITNHKNEITKSINEELDKIDDYIEQVLFYSRSNNVEKDYMINKLELVDIVNKVIKRNKKVLINKKIKVNLYLNDSIYSDAKWLEFIINQIIINSIKYEASKIEIKSIKHKNNIELLIVDNGIGILKNELDRVFDKGFTGSNGRKNYKSTGIGLYLCKKLCIKLGHDIKITSDKETIVSIIFPFSSIIEDIN